MADVHRGMHLLILALLAATPEAHDRVRVFIDAGHGAPGNEGNHGCFCQPEQAHTLAVAEHLGFVLQALGGFDVRLSRQGERRPGYRERVDAAKAWRADVIVSLHSDSRGEWVTWDPFNDGRSCLRSDGAPGFSVLWSEEGNDVVVAGRATLGRAVGAHLRDAGFVAYDGADYSALYRRDDVEPSGWVDVRPGKQRVYLLRATSTPTVIIETHHALNPAEVARWSELATADAFALAVAAAILETRQGMVSPARSFK